MNEIEKLSKKVDFILDIINLAEVNKFLPKELIDRSRNRMKIEQLREKIKNLGTEKNEKLEEELKVCIEKELEFEKFKKTKRRSFVSRLLGRN